MTEKRFTINLEDECIDDAEERIFISFLDKIDFYELCAFLNEQQSIIDEQKIAIDEMITDYKNLEKENEQLLKENVFLAKQRNYWKSKSDMAVETFEIDEATVKQIRKLEKENEQLKKT